LFVIDSSRGGLKNFGRGKVDLMLELLELGLKSKTFGKERKEELGSFKLFLLNYRRMVWGVPFELVGEWKKK